MKKIIMFGLAVGFAAVLCGYAQMQASSEDGCFDQWLSVFEEFSGKIRFDAMEDNRFERGNSPTLSPVAVAVFQMTDKEEQAINDIFADAYLAVTEFMFSNVEIKEDTSEETTLTMPPDPGKDAIESEIKRVVFQSLGDRRASIFWKYLLPSRSSEIIAGINGVTVNLEWNSGWTLRTKHRTHSSSNLHSMPPRIKQIVEANGWQDRIPVKPSYFSSCD